MSRIVQIAATTEGSAERMDAVLYALDEDGNVWRFATDETTGGAEWKQVVPRQGRPPYEPVYPGYDGFFQ